MPLHERGYRRYEGTRRPAGRTWLVIARHGVRMAFRQRPFIVLLLSAWSPFMVRAVQIYVASNVPQAVFLAATRDTFRDFLQQQGLFVFVVTIYVGAGLIANDRRANALQLYLSRPLTRVEYVAGKLMTLLVFLVGVTWLPAMLLLVLQVLFSGSLAFVRDNVALVPAIALYAALQVLVSGFAMLALSSMSRSSRFVGVMYAGLMFFTSAVHGAVQAATGKPSLVWLSPVSSLEIVGQTLFRTPSPSSASVPAAMVSLAVVMAGSIYVLSRRVRAVEVVG